MTSSISRFGRSRRDALAPAVILLLALGAGLFTGRGPLLGVALAAALVFALIVMSDLALGVCLFLLVGFLDAVSHNQDLSLTKGAGAVLAGSWLAMMATRPIARAPVGGAYARSRQRRFVLPHIAGR